MIWKELIVILCITFVPSYALIACDYNYDENNLYTCRMLIFNPSGGPVASIMGNHLINMTNNDVVQVISAGTTANIPTIICNSFRNLEKVEFVNLGIITLYNNPFLNCDNLAVLNLSNNSITTLLPHIFMNTHIEELYLDYNALAEVTSDLLVDLNYLKRLSLRGNDQTTITGSAFEHLINLEFLDLSECNLTDLSPGLFDNGLSQLKVLNLADNLLTDIHANTFDDLTALEILALDINKISTLNEDSFILPGLRALFLDSNKLENLPDNVFGHLQNLEILYLSDNNCANLPSNIFNPLTSLTTLGMHSSLIKNIKPEWFQSLPNLTILLLEENEIREIPDRTFDSTNLKLLSLYGNQLNELSSKSFGSVEDLSHLDVRNNQMIGIDHHLMNRTTAMKVAMFSDNLCADFNTLSYDLEPDAYMGQLKDCFDNYDRTPFVLKTNNSESYEWYNIRLNDRWRDIEFNITASESAHIGLTDSITNQDLLIEIRIGALGNTVFQIIDRGQEKFSMPLLDFLHPTEMRTFKIHLALSFITFFKNNEEFPFFGYFITDYFPINFFGMRTQIPPAGSVESAFWSVRRIQT